MVDVICVLEENIQINLFPNPANLLNKRSDLIARCRHKNKFAQF